MYSSRRLVLAGLIAATLMGGAASLGAGAMPTAAHASARVAAHGTTTKYPRGTVVRLHQRVIHVKIYNFAFGPARLVVSPGAKIIWTNLDSDPHTVTSTKNIWTSDALDTGNTYARVFKKTGSFAYYCEVHPFMHGTVIVAK